MLKHPVLTCLLLTQAVACTHGAKPKAKEPVGKSAAAESPKAGSKEPASQGQPTPAGATTAGPAEAPPAAAAPAPAPAPIPDDPCRVLAGLPSEPPIVVTGQSVVLTRLMKPCTTLDGRSGYDKGTPWTAMGFPCTGGSGRIDIKGMYHNPKMISFILGTDCAMSPSAREVVQKSLTEALALPPESRLVAYTPFVVQFWEIPGFSDTDVGFSIDLRSPAALEGGWKKFREKEPLPVKLYGRENAWVQGGALYEVEGAIKMTDRTSFQLEIKGIRALSADEIATVKGRCDMLRPRRNCAEAF